MNAMRRPTLSSLSTHVGLLALAVAACSGVGQDGFVTVGIRPSSDKGDSQVVGPVVPVSGSDVTFDPSDNAAEQPAQPIAGAGAGPAPAPEIPAVPVSAAGAGATESATAGAAAAPMDAVNEDECGAIPAQPAGNVSAGIVNGAGLIEYDTGTPNVFVGLRTTLTVPATPEPTGHVYVWPGLQPAPYGTKFQPIGNGALMSALTWGAVCTADTPADFSSWWIAPLYTNPSSSDPEYSGCKVGDVTLVAPKQLVDVDIHLEGETWVQRVVNRHTLESSDLSLDLQGQEQGRAFFAIAPQTSNKPTEDIVFTNTVLYMERPEPEACEPVRRGVNDFASRPRVSADGTRCCIDRIVLRAPRAVPTTVDPP